MKQITREEALKLFPFIEMILKRHAIQESRIKFYLTQFDVNFRRYSLIETVREGINSLHDRSSLFIVSQNYCHRVGIGREYGVVYDRSDEGVYDSYLNDIITYPEDLKGRSETMSEALKREDLERAQYIILYRYGIDLTEFNELIIASLN
ncbi:hypothetical protein EPN15_05845 [Patescibacteria group bacterium]|nr:MAG: hypothetical protein EPN15_05845 [Patescibacteria group bacterium]